MQCSETHIETLFVDPRLYAGYKNRVATDTHMKLRQRETFGECMRSITSPLSGSSCCTSLLRSPCLGGGVPFRYCFAYQSVI